MIRRFRVLTAVGFAVLLIAVIAFRVPRPSIVRFERPDNSGSEEFLAESSSGRNWPQFRGPTFDAVSTETELADSWPDDGPPLVWTRELGEGYSSFIGVNDRVFTQYQTLYQQLVACLDAETGQTIWSHFYSWPYEGGALYPGPRSTPTWYDGRIYFAAPDGMVGCLSAGSGEPIWSVNPKKRFRGRGTDFGYASSPVVLDGKVIIPVGGDNSSVVALDARDGSLVWSAGDSSASYATPLPIRWNGKSRVIVPLENSIAAFDTQSGQHLWEVEFSQGYDEHSAAPIYCEPFLCVASPFRSGAKCYKLIERNEAGSKTDASSDGAADDSTDTSHEVTELSWESPKLSNDVCSSVLFEGRLYGFDLKDVQSRQSRPSRGEFRCLDFRTGKVIWSTDKVGQSSVIVADQKLILFVDTGELILARLGTDDYIELARTTVFRDEVCWTSPALHRGYLYLRTQTRAACIDLRKSRGSSPKSAGRVQDIPHGRLLDAAILVGSEREFPAAAPSSGEFVAWYLWSLVCFAGGWAISVIVYCVGRRLQRRKFETIASPLQDRSVLIARILLWLIVTVAGVIGSPIINARQSEYVLLWPLVLWAAFQITINVITWTERQPDRRWPRWMSRATTILFLGTCVLYFSLCRGLGYAIEWAFLIGFLPAFPIAAWAGRWLTWQVRCWPVTDAIFMLLSWSVYFWSSVIFISSRLAVGT